jgi:hypothetical protein
MREKEREKRDRKEKEKRIKKRKNGLYGGEVSALMM